MVVYHRQWWWIAGMTNTSWIILVIEMIQTINGKGLTPRFWRAWSSKTESLPPKMMRFVSIKAPKLMLQTFQVDSTNGYDNNHSLVMVISWANIIWDCLRPMLVPVEWWAMGQSYEYASNELDGSLYFPQSHLVFPAKLSMFLSFLMVPDSLNQKYTIIYGYVCPFITISRSIIVLKVIHYQTLFATIHHSTIIINHS